jgi:hypothetical protein
MTGAEPGLMGLDTSHSDVVVKPIEEMTTASSWDDFYAELRQEAADAGAEHVLEAWERYFRDELALIRMREGAGLQRQRHGSAVRAAGAATPVQNRRISPSRAAAPDLPAP